METSDAIRELRTYPDFQATLDRLSEARHVMVPGLVEDRDTGRIKYSTTIRRVVLPCHVNIAAMENVIDTAGVMEGGPAAKQIKPYDTLVDELPALVAGTPPLVLSVFPSGFGIQDGEAVTFKVSFTHGEFEPLPSVYEAVERQARASLYAGIIVENVVDVGPTPSKCTKLKTSYTTHIKADMLIEAFLGPKATAPGLRRAAGGPGSSIKTQSQSFDGHEKLFEVRVPGVDLGTFPVMQGSKLCALRNADGLTLKGAQAPPLPSFGVFIAEGKDKAHVIRPGPATNELVLRYDSGEGWSCTVFSASGRAGEYIKKTEVAFIESGPVGVFVVRDNKLTVADIPLTLVLRACGFGEDDDISRLLTGQDFVDATDWHQTFIVEQVAGVRGIKGLVRGGLGTPCTSEYVAQRVEAFHARLDSAAERKWSLKRGEEGGGGAGGSISGCGDVKLGTIESEMDEDEKGGGSSAGSGSSTDPPDFSVKTLDAIRIIGSLRLAAQKHGWSQNSTGPTSAWRSRVDAVFDQDICPTEEDVHLVEGLLFLRDGLLPHVSQGGTRHGALTRCEDGICRVSCQTRDILIKKGVLLATMAMRIYTATKSSEPAPSRDYLGTQRYYGFAHYARSCLVHELNYTVSKVLATAMGGIKGVHNAPGSPTHLVKVLLGGLRSPVFPSDVVRALPTLKVGKGVMEALRCGTWAHVVSSEGPVNGMFRPVMYTNAFAVDSACDVCTKCAPDAYGAGDSRNIAVSSVPFVCQVSTPDGANTGLSNHLSMGTTLSLGCAISQAVQEDRVLACMHGRDVRTLPLWEIGRRGGLLAVIRVVVNGVPVAILCARATPTAVSSEAAAARDALLSEKRSLAEDRWLPIDADVAATRVADPLMGVHTTDPGPAHMQEVLCWTGPWRPVHTFIVLQDPGDVSVRQLRSFARLAAAVKLFACIQDGWKRQTHQELVESCDEHDDAYKCIRAHRGGTLERDAVYRVMDMARGLAENAGGAIAAACALDADGIDTNSGFVVCLSRTRYKRCQDADVWWRLVASSRMVTALKAAILEAQLGEHPLLERMGIASLEFTVVKQQLSDEPAPYFTHCMPSPFSHRSTQAHGPHQNHIQYARQGFAVVQRTQYIPGMSPVDPQPPLSSVFSFAGGVTSRVNRTAHVSSPSTRAVEEWQRAFTEAGRAAVEEGRVSEDMLCAVAKGLAVEHRDGVLPEHWVPDVRQAAECGQIATVGIMSFKHNDNDAVSVCKGALERGLFMALVTVKASVRMARTLPLTCTGTEFRRGVCLSKMPKDATPTDVDVLVRALRTKATISMWQHSLVVREHALPLPFYIMGCVQPGHPAFDRLVSGFANPEGATEVVYPRGLRVARAVLEEATGLDTDGTPFVDHYSGYRSGCPVLAYTLVRPVQGKVVTLDTGRIREALVLTRVEVTYGMLRVPHKGIGKNILFNVDSVAVMGGEGPERPVDITITLTRVRRPTEGDKITTPSAQKGTIQHQFQGSDAPYTLTEQMVAVGICPTGFTTRCLVGECMEIRETLEAANQGMAFVDASSGRYVPKELGGEGLAIAPCPRTGSAGGAWTPESTYSWTMVPEASGWNCGAMGKLPGSPVAVGPLCLLATKHLASVATCNNVPVLPINHQPASGVANNGGLKWGVMERDVFTMVGCSKMLKHFYQTGSDGTEVLVHSKCGSWHQIPGASGAPQCRDADCAEVHSGKGIGAFGMLPVAVPYSFVLSMNLLEAMGVKVVVQPDGLLPPLALTGPFKVPAIQDRLGSDNVLGWMGVDTE